VVWRAGDSDCLRFGKPYLFSLVFPAETCHNNNINTKNTMTASAKNYRVRVETYDGLQTVWWEKSRANRACDLIANRVYNQLCGLNVKEIEVTPSV